MSGRRIRCCMRRRTAAINDNIQDSWCYKRSSLSPYHMLLIQVYDIRVLGVRTLKTPWQPAKLNRNSLQILYCYQIHCLDSTWPSRPEKLLIKCNQRKRLLYNLEVDCCCSDSHNLKIDHRCLRKRISCDLLPVGLRCCWLAVGTSIDGVVLCSHMARCGEGRTML